MPGDQAKACFIDTNIWLYAFVEGDDGGKSARSRLLIQQAKPVVSTQVINEVCVNLLRQAHFAEDTVRQLVESFYEKYEVIESGKSILLMASQVRQRYSISFWDSMIVASALSAGVPILYSEDLQHELSIEGHLQVLNPFVLV